MYSEAQIRVCSKAANFKSRGVYSTGATGAQAPTEIQQRVPGTRPEMTQVWLFHQKHKCVA